MTQFSFIRYGCLTCMFPFQSGDAHTAACESCGKEFPSASALRDHLVSSCPEKIVPCRHGDSGCPWRGRRVSLETHVDKCPYESIKGFLAIHSTQMTRLSKDNERLRRRADELEGTVQILRQEIEWAKIALGPWYRPVYPERPAMSAHYAQSPNNDATTGSAPSRVGPILFRGADPTSGTSLPEPRAENGATGVFEFVDPFSFISQGENQVQGVYTINGASTTMSATNTGSDTRPSVDAVESHSRTDHTRNANHEPGPSGPGSLNGLGSIYNTAGATQSPGVSNLQSTSTVPPVVLLSDYFPSEERQGWQHGTLPADSVPPNPSSTAGSSVSIFTVTTPIGRGGLQFADRTLGNWGCLQTESATYLRADSLLFGLLVFRSL